MMMNDDDGVFNATDACLLLKHSARSLQRTARIALFFALYTLSCRRKSVTVILTYMYKTAVYTLVNGNIQGLTHQKQENRRRPKRAQLNIQKSCKITGFS